jgi:cytochrome oxidase Cu insertion factor (SCO1/SenC/PrrC family)
VIWRVACAAAGVFIMLAVGAVAWTGSRPVRVVATAAVPAGVPPVIPALGFRLPAVGSYQLEHIQVAPDGAVLDSDRSAHRLREFTTGKVTLFAFIYTYCTDAKGCPLAYATLVALRQMIADDPGLCHQVRFVSMSFDPENDTPAMMRRYAGEDARILHPLSWHFLTAPSAAALAPILDGFGQDASVALPHAPGRRVPVLRHLLKVYLLDAAGSVREIYSPAYLHPLILHNDVVTLLHEGAPLSASAATACRA